VRIPLISYVASASQGLPILASFRFGRALPPARRWLVGWATLLLVEDAVSLWYAMHHTENLWLRYVVGPLAIGTVLMALSYWQPSSRLRTIYRLMIPFLVLTSIAAVTLIEDTSTHSIVTGPFKNLILFAASLATVLTCAWRLEGSLTRQDWFWIGIGLALEFGSNAGFDPIARILVGQDLPTLVRIHEVGAWIDLAAFLLIARGMLCPILRLRVSSGPTLSASSPSPSSSPHSAPPW
jgi:hypothetical protein